MPMFDYECVKCHHVDERIVSIIDPLPQYCGDKECACTEPMKKLESFGPSRLNFKGKWYVNTKEY